MTFQGLIRSGSQSIDANGFRGHIAELDAFRAFGIVMVILKHMWPGDPKPLSLVWMLMDTFFVVSGFLITGILLDSRSRPDYYRSFFSRRALRILPIYYAVLFVLTLGTVLGSLYGEMLRNWGSPFWFFLYVGNIPTAITGAFPAAARGAFGPLWSLQIEEQFYILFPFLVSRLSLRSLARLLLLMVVISPIIRFVIYWLQPHNELAQYVFLPCRMEGLALGALLAVRFRLGKWEVSRGRLTAWTAVWVAGACISCAWGGYVLYSPFNRTFGYLISSIASAYAVLWLIAFRGSCVTAWLRLRPVQYLGKISYSAYLFHMMVGAGVTMLGVMLGIKELERGYPRVLMVLAGTLVCSALSWRFFEHPILRWGQRYSALTRARQNELATDQSGKAA